ncbi:MAG: dihydrodipicolinate synthase family protein [Clostridia bacterium]|nr:dihydrodipicolinate synthase family protein [Clostridia bacterium]
MNPNNIKFTGVMPALVTPLTEREEVNVPVLHQLINAQIAQGADGFYIGGATGEGIALRQDVRECLATEAVKAIAGRKPAILHIASAVYGEAIALAKQAEAAGADCISAIPPLFYGYDEDEVFNYYKTLANAVSIPLLVYYNPAAGFNMRADFAARLFTIDNVTAIKWTSSDYYGMLRLKDLTHGEMNIINGPDEMLLMGLSAGADGGIGSTYNVILPLIKGVYDNFRAGNLDAAREFQTRADRIINVVLKYKVIPAVKVMLEGQGFPVGDSIYPMRRYTDAEKQSIYATLREAGMEI